MALERRHFLFAGAGLSGAVLAAQAAPAKDAVIDLSDPGCALRSYVKLRGSTADETVFQPYEGDIFAIVDGVQGVPLCGFIGLQKSVWRRDGVGFTNADYDIGFFVDSHTRQILRHWRNPLTGQVVEVLHYRGGPSGGHFTVDAPAGDVYGEATGRWSCFGGHAWHTSSNCSTRPNAMDPAKWPRASSGRTLLGTMSISFSGLLSELADPACHQVSGLQVWTNTTSWMPWMEMGQRPGFNEWRWIGAKGTPPERLPATLVVQVEAVWPGYVHGDRVWKVPTSGRTDYMRIKLGLPATR